MDRTLKTALISLVLNATFSVYYFVFGIASHSWWLLLLGVYHLILSVVRVAVLRAKSKKRFVTWFAGWMLIALELPLVGTVILSVVGDNGRKFHMIVMLAIATYAFSKITLATVNLIKSRHSTSATLIILRNISFADAVVSIFALQRSMLVSFEGMGKTEIVAMNTALGSAVCIIVFLLGLNLIRYKKIPFHKLKNVQ